MHSSPSLSLSHLPSCCFSPSLIVFSGNWGPNGFWDVEWSFIDPANHVLGVTYFMVGSPSCLSSGSATHFYTTILLKCARTQGPLTVATDMNCNTNYTLPTPLACPPAHMLTQLDIDYINSLDDKVQLGDEEEERSIFSALE